MVKQFKVLTQTPLEDRTVPSPTVRQGFCSLCGVKRVKGEKLGYFLRFFLGGKIIEQCFFGLGCWDGRLKSQLTPPPWLVTGVLGRMDPSKMFIGSHVPLP